jgi:hypothetical protein
MVNFQHVILSSTPVERIDVIRGALHSTRAHESFNSSYTQIYQELEPAVSGSRERLCIYRNHGEQNCCTYIFISKCMSNTIQDLIMAPVRVATSKPARQTYLNTILFMITSAILLGLAALAYILFYFNYVPQIGIVRIIHLQYG